MEDDETICKVQSQPFSRNGESQ